LVQSRGETPDLAEEIYPPDASLFLK
jgi:hypothetical protein